LPSLGDRFNSPETVTKSIRNYWAERQGIRLLQYD
jgi:hypothetical protein